MTVAIRFLGGAREVTGSCILVEAGKTRFLVDCGLFQGGAEGDRKNERPFPVPPASIRFVLLTHAHLDHCGLLPRLVREGFRGPILATPATADLAAVMLPDAAHIQEKEAEWRARRAVRAGRRERIAPLYTAEDAAAVFPLLSPVPYGEAVSPAPGIRVLFLDAGHILGSAILSVAVRDGGGEKSLVFTGDLGHRGLPIVRDFTPVEEADVVVMESTYGDRAHKGMEETIAEFVHAVTDTIGRKGGNVLIPAFAVGRAQDILYLLTDLARQQKLPDTTVYIDSPLAAEATRVTLRHPECFDEETRRLFAWRNDHPGVPRILVTQGVEESKALNDVRGAVILAGSGMCEAGRIKHHLKHNLWRKEASVVIVGFQAQGTLGRKIVDGAKTVTIFGEEIAVQADVYTIGGLSAHADRDDLLRWAGSFRRPPGAAFVAHGEERVSLSFAEALRRRFRWSATVPEAGRIIVV